MQMLDTLNTYQQLRSAFEHDCEVAFRDFVRSTGVTKWIVAADFVTSGTDRANDTFAFTVYPHDNFGFDHLCSRARVAIPRDIKHTRLLTREAAAFLVDRRRFHFCFMARPDRHQAESLSETRAVIASARDWARTWPASESKDFYLRKLDFLVQKSKARSFDYRLVGDMALLSVLVSYLAMLVVKHSRPEMIMIICDRDRMNTAFDGIGVDLMHLNYGSIASAEGVSTSGVHMTYGIDREARNGQQAWFDDLIRAPDYIAGAMARWDFWNNDKSQAQPMRPKFIDVIEAAVVENPHVALFALQFDVFGVRCSRVRAFRLQGNDRSAYKHQPSQMVDYLVHRALRATPPCRQSFRRGVETTTLLTPLHV